MSLRDSIDKLAASIVAEIERPRAEGEAPVTLAEKRAALKILMDYEKRLNKDPGNKPNGGPNEFDEYRKRIDAASHQREGSGGAEAGGNGTGTPAH